MKLKLYSSPEEDKKIIFMISSLNFLEPVAYRKKEITRGFVVSNGKFSSIIARPSLSIRENWNFILVATCQWQLTTWLPRPPHLEANDFIHSIYFCMTKNKYRPLQTLAYICLSWFYPVFSSVLFWLRFANSCHNFHNKIHKRLLKMNYVIIISILCECTC